MNKYGKACFALLSSLLVSRYTFVRIIMSVSDKLTTSKIKHEAWYKVEFREMLSGHHGLRLLNAV